MKLSLFLFAFLAFAPILALAAAMARRSKRAARGGPAALKGRPVMTEREQAMYWRLKETFPGSVVLAQVAFSALMTSPREHRNRFDRKVADFVLCDPSLKAQVVIELDDAFHQGRARQDAAREKLLVKAGYKVLRFANVRGSHRAGGGADRGHGQQQAHGGEGRGRAHGGFAGR